MRTERFDAFDSRRMCLSALSQTRDLLTTPRVVVWQYDQHEWCNPNGLLVAYEEHGKVTPVASDIDAFTIGCRGMRMEKPLPSEQLKLVSSMVSTRLESASDVVCETRLSSYGSSAEIRKRSDREISLV